MKKIFTLFAAIAGFALCTTAQAPVDWANFKRFEQANKEQSQNPKVVLMGNSITEGWAAKRPNFFTVNDYVGRGISGQTSSQMLVRFRADVVNLHPKIVAICAGTNDIAQNNGYISLEHIFDNIVSMVEIARANGIVPVLCSVLPARQYSWRKDLQPAQEIIKLNAMIRAYARKEKISYVDYHTPMAEADGGMIAAYTYDGVHPTEAGYEVMENILRPVIDTELLIKKHRHLRRK